jgi:hypothetical protein
MINMFKDHASSGIRPMPIRQPIGVTPVGVDAGLGAGLGAGAGAGGRGGGGMRAPIMGSFHKGGDVTKDGAYLLEKGEKVTAATTGSPGFSKRDSEYRRVYLSRKKKKDEK